MKLIRDQKVVEDDTVKLDDTAALPASGRIIVSLARWHAEKDALKKRGQVGTQIPPTLEVGELKDDLPCLACIELTFAFIKPKPEGGITFDGRAYSQARLLRERYGYKGDIRAVGDIFRDTIFAMHRCGINVIEPKAGLDAQDALNAFKDFSLAYQTAADRQPSIFRRRLA
ncbi:MAG: DUF934 domain-containing protein [Pseudomonadota bacterium]